MDLKPIGKELAWLSGTLLIGALGSGLWEVLLKPSFVWVGTFALDIATLGLNSLRDGMYLDAARGGYERAALATFSMGTGVMCGFLVAGISIAYIKNKRQQMAESGDPQTRKKKPFWLLSTVGTILVIVIFIQFYRVSYVTRAASYVDQLIVIVSPYTQQEDVLKFRSRVAQIQTRSDYFELVYELREIGKAHALKLPDFDVY